MNQLPSRARDTDRPPNATSSQGAPSNAARLPGPSADEPMLSAIDRVIRSLVIVSPLRAMLSAEPAAASCLGECGHHPDSLDVLGWCRRRHPDWTEFPQQTVRVVCQRLLYDRWAMAVLWRIAEEPLPTIQRVLSEVARLAPHGSDDDAWWVWRQLVVFDPENVGYRYSQQQIRRGWRAVNARRLRWDGAGGAPGRRVAAKCRLKATAQLAAELYLKKTLLAALDIDDYCDIDGTLVPHGNTPSREFHLSDTARYRMDRWLDIRGVRPGNLFDCPSVGKRQSLDDYLRAVDDETLAPNAGDMYPMADCEDLAEQLCVGLGEDAYAFILETIAEQGGWSMRFVDHLSAHCPSFVGNGPFNCRLSRQQRWRARTKIRARAATWRLAE